MMSLSRPSDQQIEEFLTQQRSLDFTYQEVGATQSQIPTGFVVDRTRSQIGSGIEQFEKAKQELTRWQHFQLGWVEPCWPETAVEKDEVVGVLARWSGIWFLNACRIVYLVEHTSDRMNQFGFAYGTLPEHAECGEERFLLEYDSETQRLDYEILAFSKPNKWYTKLGYPLVRRTQKRFARDSISAMQRAIKTA